MAAPVPAHRAEIVAWPDPVPDCPECGGTGTIRQRTAAIWADEVLACMCIWDQMQAASDGEDRA